jgi:Flp pilus assembly protein TadG
MRLARLGEDLRGAAAVEFALAVPVLVTLMIGILQFGIVLHASGAVRHAVGEGIRHAKVYADATEAQVYQKIRDSMAGVNPAGITSLEFDRGTANGADFGRVTMQYKLQPVIPFAAIPPITFNETRTAYLPR